MKNQRFLVICDYIDFEKTYTRKSLLTLISIHYTDLDLVKIFPYLVVKFLKKSFEEMR